MKSMREREAERRAQKLDDVRRQVADGSLVIRQMTGEERKRYVAVSAVELEGRRRQSSPSAKPSAR